MCIGSAKNMIIISESTKNLYESMGENVNLSESTQNLHESMSKNVNLSESIKNLSESMSEAVNLSESTKNLSESMSEDVNLSESTKNLSESMSEDVNLSESAQNLYDSMSESVNPSESMSENVNLSGSAKDGFEKSKSWVEEEKSSKSTCDKKKDLLIKGGGALLQAAAHGYLGGLGSACGFLLSCVPPDNYYYQMAQNKIEMSKNWAAEKLRERGITDKQRDLLIKAGGAVAVVASASVGYYGFKGRSGTANASDDIENLMKAPGRPGEFIERRAFEANPRDYFRKLRGKHP